MPSTAEPTLEHVPVDKRARGSRASTESSSKGNPMPKFQKARTHQHLITLIDCVPKTESTTHQWYKSVLEDVIDSISMEVLISPRIKTGPYGITGVVGIVTSHIAFHHFPQEQHLQLDIYSCKPFDAKKVMVSLARYWSINSVSGLEIDRSANNLVLNSSPCVNDFRYDGEDLRSIGIK